MTDPSRSPTCRVCRSTLTELWKHRNVLSRLSADDIQITDAQYGRTLALYRCTECSFVFSDDREVTNLAGLYEHLTDPRYESTNDSRARQMRWLLSIGRGSHPRARTLLDIGAATGLLVRQARMAGFDAAGIEPSTKLVEAARRLNHVTLLQGTFPHPALAEQRFDLIYVIDVLEHVDDPVGLLRAVQQSLAEDGLAVISTPDIGSIAARLLGHRWWHLRPAHIGYFSRRSFTRAIESAGLSLHASRTAKWYFPLAYIMDRLAIYLPALTLLKKLAGALPLINRLFDMILPLNLGDSRLFIVRRG